MGYEPALNDSVFYDDSDFIECKECKEYFDHNKYNSKTCESCEDKQVPGE